MFWEKYHALCTKSNKTPSAVAKEIGITSGTVSGWKRGNKPQELTIAKIEKYFGVPTGYFNEEAEKNPMQLSIGEENLIRLYRSFSIEEKSNIQAYLASLEEAKRGKQ